MDRDWARRWVQLRGTRASNRPRSGRAVPCDSLDSRDGDFVAKDGGFRESVPIRAINLRSTTRSNPDHVDHSLRRGTGNTGSHAPSKSGKQGYTPQPYSVVASERSVSLTISTMAAPEVVVNALEC